MATHRHNCEYVVADETDVNFEVQFITAANTGSTGINVPGDLDPEIEDAGTKFIGKGRDLRSPQTIVSSAISNPAAQVDHISVTYLVNGSPIYSYSKPKSVDKQPLIIIKISFTKP